MASVFDVAKYILNKQGVISTWKLQKLCYYAQAWSLAWTGKPLFNEDFQAWSNGPVCRELYDCHKGLFQVSAYDLNYGCEDNLTADEQDTVNVVLRDYGGMSPYELRELSHSEPPWRDARNGLADGERSEKVRTKSAIGEYYGSL